jgi:hypothetical protein
MLDLPGGAVWLIKHLEHFSDQARLELTGHLGQPQDDELKIVVGERAAAMAQAWHARPDPQDMPINRSAAAILDFLLISTGDHGPGIWLGLEAILNAQITGMWTAFEVLAGDLWEAALNSHPHGLAELKGKRKKNGESKHPPLGAEDLTAPTAAKEADELRLVVSRSFLQRNKFDLKSLWGTALKPEDGFAGLKAIREAYVRAFHKDYQEIDDAVMSPCFDKLSSVRNVIVHRGGFADDKFLREVKNFSEFCGIGHKERIPIDGRMVDSLVRPAIDQSCALIKAVDAWIVDHPVKVKS